MPIDVDTLHRERDQLHAHLGNIMRMLEGVRKADGSYTYAVVSMTCAAAENALEAALDSVRKAKHECRLTTYQHKLKGSAFDPARVTARPAGLPQVVSPCAAE